MRQVEHDGVAPDRQAGGQLDKLLPLVDCHVAAIQDDRDAAGEMVLDLLSDGERQEVGG